MKTLITDVETESLTPSKVHCIVTKDAVTQQKVKYRQQECYTNFPSDVSGDVKFVMHNGLSFDAPVCNDLLGTEIKPSQVYDTMLMSQLAEPDMKGGHSLEAWGGRFKYPKIEFNDYEWFSEEMVTYCERDVDITGKVYRYLQKALSNFSPESIRLETQVRAIVSQQERNGFAFDIQNATILVAHLNEEKYKVEETIRQTMLPMSNLLRHVTPKYKNDGAMSKVGLAKLGDGWTNVSGPFSLVEFVEFNVGSRQQIGKQLIRKGWKPKQFTDTGQPTIDESVLEGVNFPEAKLIYRYLMLEKRIGQLDNWINAYNHDTGCIHGKVITIGAVTTRMAHHSPNVAQAVAVYSPYGKEMRALWKPRGNRVLLGADASGLELRCFAHYVGDQDYISIVVDGDVHTANMNALGITDREVAKTFIYAFLYGAGVKKIAAILGFSSKKAKEAILSFEASIPGLAKLRAKVKKAAIHPYIKGLDGRLLKIRHQHAALNTLLQAMGAIVCKVWLVQIMKRVHAADLDVLLVASIHDEYQFDVCEEDAEALGEITRLAIKDAEKILGVKCPLDAGYKIGNNWACTH
jgi:DNA polymerase I